MLSTNIISIAFKVFFYLNFIFDDSSSSLFYLHCKLLVLLYTCIVILKTLCPFSVLMFVNCAPIYHDLRSVVVFLIREKGKICYGSGFGNLMHIFTILIMRFINILSFH